MRSKIGSFVAFCLLVSVCAASQSLGDLARKERERRDKNKDTGVSARQFSEDEIFEDEDEQGESAGEEGEGDSELDESEEAEVSGSPLPNRIDIAVEADGSEELENESRDRERYEAEWRNRISEARSRLALAREQKTIWDGVHYVEGITLVDENGNVVVDNLDDLRRYVAQANQELTDAEQALKRLEEEARRAGVPPGWLR